MFSLVYLPDFSDSYTACEDHMNEATNCNTSSDWSVTWLGAAPLECDYCY